MWEAFTPYGYRKDENNRNQLVVDEYAGEIVRFIFTMYKDGVSIGAIADRLNSILRAAILRAYSKRMKQPGGLILPSGGFSPHRCISGIWYRAKQAHPITRRENS